MAKSPVSKEITNQPKSAEKKKTLPPSPGPAIRNLHTFLLVSI
jgi:hypothetical protein